MYDSSPGIDLASSGSTPEVGPCTKKYELSVMHNSHFGGNRLSLGSDTASRTPSSCARSVAGPMTTAGKTLIFRVESPTGIVSPATFLVRRLSSVGRAAHS